MRLRPGRRSALAAVLAGSLLGTREFAVAATRPQMPAPHILERASVSDRGRGDMPPDLWQRLVATFAGPASVALPEDETADAAGCRTAGGDYLIGLAFDSRPDLPGMPNASDRMAGSAHLVVLSCADGRSVVDRYLRLDADPVPPSVAGTADALEDAWKSVPAILANAGVVLGRVVRVRALDAGGYALAVDVLVGRVRRGDALLDTARANASPRRTPLRLTVTKAKAGATEIEATFAPANAGDPLPDAGDFVESAPG